jgi:hypothetical protein
MRQLLFILLGVFAVSLANARVVLSKPGCYRISGNFMGEEGQKCMVQIYPESRSQQNLMLQIQKPSNFLRGVKVSALVKVEKTGYTDEMSMLKAYKLKLLKPNSDIYTAQWYKVKDAHCN